MAERALEYRERIKMNPSTGSNTSTYKREYRKRKKLQQIENIPQKRVKTDAERQLALNYL